MKISEWLRQISEKIDDKELIEVSILVRTSDKTEEFIYEKWSKK